MNHNAATLGSAGRAVLLAVDHLSVSRRHLQLALKPPPHPSNAGDASSRSLFSRWLDRLATAPAARVVRDAVQRGWSDHPPHLAWLLADDAVQTLIQPAAQKHPYRLVLGAAAAGALLVLSRPWRWLPPAALTSTLMASLLPPLINKAFSPLSGSTWVGLLAALTQQLGLTPDRR